MLVILKMLPRTSVTYSDEVTFETMDLRLSLIIEGTTEKALQFIVVM